MSKASFSRTARPKARRAEERVGFRRTLRPVTIYIGNALTNATAQTVSGDASLGTNGTVTLATTGTAGTYYGPFVTDSKGRVTSGGNTSASAALAALGGIASSSGVGTNNVFVTPLLEPGNGANISILFPATTNQNVDQGWIIGGSPWSTGGNTSYQMKSTNVIGSPDANGYYNFDPQSFSMMAVGLQALEGNYPGINLIVGNGEPQIFANSGGTAGNVGWLQVESGSGTFGSTGLRAHFPYYPNTTHHRVFTTTYTIGTNTVTFPMDGLTDTMEVDESAGLARFAQKAAFGGPVAIGSTNAASSFIETFTANASSTQHLYGSATGNASGHGFAFDFDGTPQTGGHNFIFFVAGPADGNAGGFFWYDSTRGGLDGGWDGSANWIPGSDNSFSMGKSGATWSQVWTHALEMPQATNSATGSFVLNGTSTVNVGNTFVTASSKIICTEASANGGTQSGNVFLTGQTAATGFAVKGVALDTSIVNYVIVQGF